MFGCPVNLAVVSVPNVDSSILVEGNALDEMMATDSLEEAAEN